MMTRVSIISGWKQAQFSKIITIIYCLPAAGAGSKDGMFSE
jgi:hypothetical protein